MPDSDEDDDGTLPPPSPDDRLWRHPSELAALAAASPAPPPPSARRRPLLAVAVLSGLAGAAATVVSLAALGALAPPPSETTSTGGAVPVTSTSVGTRSASAVATMVAPAVVEVIATGDEPRTGSGVVARSDGLVLTSAQLVAGASAVRVRWPSGREATATVEGTDAPTGLAALSVGGSGHPTATLDMTPPEVGEATISVSARSDGAAPVVVEGVVSATGTHVTSDDVQLVGLIETDQPLPEGADGGALVDADGHLRGVCLAVDDDAGWAVPAEIALRVADDLRRLGRVDRGWLGIFGVATDDERSVPAGFTVEEVTAGSPAEQVGLAVGDVVIAIDDQRVRSFDDVKAALTLTRPGQEVVVEVARPDATTADRVAVLARAPGG